MRHYSKFHLEAIEKVKALWHMYIINERPEKLGEALGALPEELVLIGTGRHEFYKSREEFVKGMTADQVEARNIQFELQDEWYDIQEVSEDVCIVYGSIWAREKMTPGKTVLVDMEGSRFTVVCRKKSTGDRVEICSVHHSMPYMDQGGDEYYPKSLASLAEEAVRKSKALEHRAEMDPMTELYNRVYMERHVAATIKKESACFFAIDLDGFKAVNDSMDHLVGDQVIREFAGLLRRVFAPGAILGRMGGDEFAAWDASVYSREGAEKRFAALCDGCRRLSKQLGTHVSCSMGITVCHDGR